MAGVKKSKNIQVAATERQYEYWSQIAEMTNQNLASFMRNAADMYCSSYIKAKNLKYDVYTNEVVKR